MPLCLVAGCLGNERMREYNLGSFVSKFLLIQDNSVLTTQLLLLAPFFSWPGLRSLRKTESPAAVSQGSRTSQTTKSYAFITLTLITVFSLISTIFRLPVTPPKPHKQGKTDKRLFNAGIWTVHFGFDNEGHDSQRGMRELIRDMELDVVGLLETDLQRTAFGHRDLTRVLVEDLGYVSVPSLNPLFGVPT